MFGLGLPEVALMTVVVLLVFGPSRLPQLGKSIGGAISNFRSSVSVKEDGGKHSEKDRINSV
jgi:sec-independent protein translocase protein TatA